MSHIGGALLLITYKGIISLAHNFLNSNLIIFLSLKFNIILINHIYLMRSRFFIPTLRLYGTYRIWCVLFLYYLLFVFIDLWLGFSFFDLIFNMGHKGVHFYTKLTADTFKSLLFLILIADASYCCLWSSQWTRWSINSCTIRDLPLILKVLVSLNT